MPFLGVQPTDTFASVAKQTITGDGSVTYTLTHSVANANDLAVFVNNVRQEPTVAYSASGTSITFTEAIDSTDDCYVVYIARTFQSVTPDYPLENFSSKGIDDNATSTQITLTNTATTINNSLKPSSITFTGATGISWDENIGDIAYDRYGINYGAFRLNFTYDGSTIARFLSSGEFELYNGLTVDTNTLVVDSTNNRVGIGASSPSEALTVSGSGTSARISLTDSDSARASMTGLLEFDGTDNRAGFIGYDAGNMSLYAAVGDIKLSTAGAERMRIDSSGNVGIGASDPSDAGLVIDAKGNANTSASVRFKSNVDTYLRVARFGTGVDSTITLGNNYNRNSGSFVADNSAYPVHNITFNTDGSMRFGTGAAGSSYPTERMRILSSGGITFNGDTATANALDDYEEGTWTPIVVVTEGPAEGASPSYSGTYTKIGNRVYATCTINLNNAGDVFAVNDRLSCGGLPFTSQRSTISGVGTGWAYSVFSSGQNCFWHVGIGTGSSWWTYCTHLDGAVAGIKAIELEFSYPTAQ